MTVRVDMPFAGCIEELGLGLVGLTLKAAMNAQVHPKLYHSVRSLNCVCLAYSNTKEEIFGNFKLAGRGSIRKPPSVISWVVCLKKLKNRGESDAAQVIRQWNQAASKQTQIIGAKAATVKNLLSIMDEQTLNLIVQSVSEFTWEGCPFSDDCLATKRIFPGKHFRATSKAWTERQVVTAESVHMMVQHVLHEHSKKPVALRKKLSKSQMEELAEQAAIVWNLSVEVKTSVPVPEMTLKDCFLEKWVQGDAKVPGLPKLDLDAPRSLLALQCVINQCVF